MTTRSSLSVGGQSHRLSGLVDPLLVHPVRNLEGGIADGPGQRGPQGPRLLAAGEIDDESGGRRARTVRPESRSAASAPAVTAIAAS